MKLPHALIATLSVACARCAKAPAKAPPAAACCVDAGAAPDAGTNACRASSPSGNGCPTDGGTCTVPLPNGTVGIGFDDLRFVSSRCRIVAPAGRTGDLDLVDPSTLAVTVVGGFSAVSTWSGGHDESVTSADEGAGFLFATDRTAGTLRVVDPAKGAIVASAGLSSGPDYVRYVAATSEVWVTEPDVEQIEIFSFTAGAPPSLAHAAAISVPGGPESLVIGATRGQAYTHLWAGQTVAIDVHSRAAGAPWTNGCSGSRGIAIDEARGFLFAGCVEGKGVALDLTTGQPISSLEVGAGVDVIDYSPRLGHLYLPGASSATMTIAAVSATGALTALGTFPTAMGAHCVATDGNGRAFVCDPSGGQLLVITDSFPSSAQ